MDFLLHPANWDLTDPSSIPYLFLDHLYITGLTLLIGLLIAFPIAFLLVRYTRLNLPVQTAASILYTIPSFAFLALHDPHHGVLARDDPRAADRLRAGRADPQHRRRHPRGGPDAGRCGARDGHESHPVAAARRACRSSLPIIVAGIRVVAVTTIGIATLGPYVGTQNLGTLIYDGIYLAPAIARLSLARSSSRHLAITVDLLLLGVQRLLNRGGQVALA